MKEDESEGSFELDNDGAAAHALEAAPVDDSIVYTTMTTLLHESMKKIKRIMIVIKKCNPIQYSPIFVYIPTPYDAINGITFDLYSMSA